MKTRTHLELAQEILRRSHDRHRIYIAASGGGAGIQQDLWQVPGISKILAGAEFPYSRVAMNNFLGFEPDHACSQKTAIQMALQAYSKALETPDCEAIGIGITAVATTLQPHKGDLRVHLAWVSADECRILESKPLLDKPHPPSFPAQLNKRMIDGFHFDEMGLRMILHAITKDDKIAWEEWMGYDQDMILKDATEEAYDALLEYPVIAFTFCMKELPNNSILFPGAFNPVHGAHEDIARTVYRLTGKPIFYALSLDPPHKERLTFYDVIHRQKCGLCPVLISKGDPLYIDKARRWKKDFVIGADALERMLDPRWGPSIDELVTEFAALGTTFYVADRLMKKDGVETPCTLAGLQARGVIPEGLNVISIPGMWSQSSSEIRAAKVAATEASS